MKTKPKAGNKLTLFFWSNSCSLALVVSAYALKHYTSEILVMGLLRGGLAGLGAWKLGGSIISTILIFLLL